jgi:hypothetical protein
MRDRPRNADELFIFEFFFQAPKPVEGGRDGRWDGEPHAELDPRRCLLVQAADIARSGARRGGRGV